MAMSSINADLLKILACPVPECRADLELRDDRLVCTGCEHQFEIAHDVCRACGQVNKSEATLCFKCQAPLPRDTVDKIINDRIKSRDQWQEHRLDVAREHKQREAEASQRRMEAFWAEEKARKAEVARRLAEKREKEKRTMLVVGIVAAVAVLALVVAAIIMALA